MFFHLVPSSGEHLRSRWIRAYHLIAAKLAKARREWNAFENQARQEYHQWYHRSFGKQLSALSEISEKSHELSTILSAFHAQCEVNGLTRRQALEHVLEAIAAKRDPFPSDEEYARRRESEFQDFKQAFTQERADQKPDRTKPASEGPEINDELLRQARTLASQAMFRRFRRPARDAMEAIAMQEHAEYLLHHYYDALLRGESFESLRNRMEEAEEEENQEEMAFQENEPSPPEPDSDVKTLYRKIVRLLHPDRGSEMDPVEKSLWNEAQDAYRRADVSTLRTVLLRIEGNGDFSIDSLESIGEIISLTQTLADQHEQVERDKRRVRKDPVYRFWASRSRPKNREKLRLEIHRQLSGDLYLAQDEFRTLESELERLQRSAGSHSPRKKPRQASRSR